MTGWIVTNDGKWKNTFNADYHDESFGGVYADAYVKWDGCVQYSRYFNTPKDADGRNADDVDNIHLCSITKTVGHLIDLLLLARSRLGGEWDDELKGLNALLNERGWSGTVCPTGEKAGPL